MKGKVSIVTGAASGIGRATAELLAAEGSRVLLADLDGAGEGVARSIESRGGAAGFIEADLTQASECEAVVSAALDLHGGIDVLINCAGTIRRATVVDTSESDWDRVMAVNVKSVYLMAREAIPEMARRGGAIVNVASGWGVTAGARAAAYCASKGAVLQLTRAMAVDHAEQGIRVNCVCPGDVDTPMLQQEADDLGMTLEALRHQSAERPMGRVGSALEVAQTVLYLVGDRARYVTGATVLVDGGGTIG